MDRRMLWLGLFSVCAIILFETVKADLASETGVLHSSSTTVLEEVPHARLSRAARRHINRERRERIKESREERVKEEPDHRKGKIESTEDKIDEDQGMIKIKNRFISSEIFFSISGLLAQLSLNIFLLMMSDEIPENDLSPGTVVFQRNMDDDEIAECWDDKEMIKMYEESLSLVEFQLSNKADGKQQKEKRKSKHASPKLEVGNDTKPKEWKVGDRCLAKYSEDGAFYLAEILKLFPEKKSCQVMYEEYGNIEFVHLHNLQEIDETVHISSSKEVQSEFGESRNEVMADPNIRNEEKPSKTTRKPVHDKGNMNFDFLLPRFPPPILTDFHGADPNLNAMLISRYLAGYYDALYLTQRDKKKHTSNNFPYSLRKSVSSFYYLIRISLGERCISQLSIQISVLQFVAQVPVSSEQQDFIKCTPFPLDCVSTLYLFAFDIMIQRGSRNKLLLTMIVNKHPYIYGKQSLHDSFKIRNIVQYFLGLGNSFSPPF
ncbi:Survival motor neuron protein [Trichinella papuae]|uniref:Survival motor neuron protein n=1 Tax=Trichinella papuae TaxID=268474 RepID=A0A0V1MDS3_9BILA|nr:Survival motor neuron protein [Trichinella papuae]